MFFPSLVCDTDRIDDGDELEVDLSAGTVRDLTNGAELRFSPVPDIMLRILNEGGLVPYIQKHKDLVIN